MDRIVKLPDLNRRDLFIGAAEVMRVLPTIARDGFIGLLDFCYSV